MKRITLPVSIPRTFFWDGLFFVKVARPFDWELRVKHLESAGGSISEEHIPVLSGNRSVTTMASTLLEAAPRAFRATRGVNFRLLITDEQLLDGADTSHHGRVPFNEFNFPTVQFYCPRVPVSAMKRFWRSMGRTSIRCELRYRT